MAITYNNLYMDIRQQLRTAGVQASTLEARTMTVPCPGRNTVDSSTARTGARPSPMPTSTTSGLVRAPSEKRP